MCIRDRDDSENVGVADSATVTSTKNTRIHQIFAAGFGVQHWIIRHGITAEDSADKIAFGAEPGVGDRSSGQAMCEILPEPARSDLAGDLPSWGRPPAVPVRARP